MCLVRFLAFFSRVLYHITEVFLDYYTNYPDNRLTLTKRACYESLDFNYQFTCVAVVIFVWVEPILVMVTCVV